MSQQQGRGSLVDTFKSVSLQPTTTANTTVYTVPTGDSGAVPPVPPTTTIIKSIIISNISGSTVNTKVRMLDSSNSNLEVLLHDANLSHPEVKEILTHPIVLEEADQIKIEAATGNAVEILLSIMEIT